MLPFIALTLIMSAFHFPWSSVAQFSQGSVVHFPLLCGVYFDLPQIIYTYCSNYIPHPSHHKYLILLCVSTRRCLKHKHTLVFFHRHIVLFLMSPYVDENYGYLFLYMCILVSSFDPKVLRCVSAHLPFGSFNEQSSCGSAHSTSFLLFISLQWSYL